MIFFEVSGTCFIIVIPSQQNQKTQQQTKKEE